VPPGYIVLVLAFQTSAIALNECRDGFNREQGSSYSIGNRRAEIPSTDGAHKYESTEFTPGLANGSSRMYKIATVSGLNLFFPGV